jgi:hypothetical protein
MCCKVVWLNTRAIKGTYNSIGRKRQRIKQLQQRDGMVNMFKISKF